MAPILTTHPDGSPYREEWFTDDTLDRSDGPAFTQWFPDGRIDAQEWHHLGHLHRDGGPAHLSYHADGQLKSRQWHRHGHQHRLDGPAYEWFSTDGSLVASSWWVDGRRLTTPQVACLRDALDPTTSPTRLTQLARSKTAVIRDAARSHPAYRAARTALPTAS